MTAASIAQTNPLNRPSSTSFPRSVLEPAPIRYRMRIPPDIGQELDRYVSAIVAALRRRFAERRDADGPDGEVILDLSEVSAVPHSALVLLANLLRRALGDNVTITLAGVSPAILAPLTAFDLPDGVAVIDSRRRRWSG